MGLVTNWSKTCPGSAHIGKLPDLPLKVGDTSGEAGPDTRAGRLRQDRDDPAGPRTGPAKIDAYHEAVARELSAAAD